METLELVKELQVQKTENQIVRSDWAKALESLGQANACIK